MKHAYLIMAHGSWNQLKLLLGLLDSENADIYIHIDKKAKNVPIDEIKACTTHSDVQIFSQYKVYWGSYAMVEAELLLFGEAHKKHYDYYHLLSGADLPIKPREYIEKFFEDNSGFEFVQYDTEERLKTDREIARRTRLYHLLQTHRRRYKIKLLNVMFTFLARAILAFQLVLGVNRMRKYPGFEIKYGSQWVSITDSLVEYILSQKELIEDVFSCTNCADELFVQSLVYNSDFEKKLYNRNYDDSVTGNMRLIDIKKRGKNGSPYTWTASDREEIKNSPCLFARKFDMNADSQIIELICGKIEE